MARTLKRFVLDIIVLLTGGILAGIGGFFLYDVGGWKLVTAGASFFCGYSLNRIYLACTTMWDTEIELKRLQKIIKERKKTNA